MIFNYYRSPFIFGACKPCLLDTEKLTWFDNFHGNIIFLLPSKHQKSARESFNRYVKVNMIVLLSWHWIGLKLICSFSFYHFLWGYNNPVRQVRLRENEGYPKMRFGVIFGRYFNPTLHSPSLILLTQYNTSFQTHSLLERVFIALRGLRNLEVLQMQLLL